MLSNDFYIGIAWSISAIDIMMRAKVDKETDILIKKIVREAGGIKVFENIGLDDFDAEILRKHYPKFDTFSDDILKKASKLLTEVCDKYNWNINNKEVTKTFRGRVLVAWRIKISRINLDMKINNSFACVTSDNTLPKDDQVVQKIYGLEIPELCSKIYTVKNFYDDIYINKPLLEKHILSGGIKIKDVNYIEKEIEKINNKRYKNMKIKILNTKGDEQIVLSKVNFESIKNRVTTEGLVLVEPTENEVIDFSNVNWNQIEKMEAKNINEIIAFRPVAGG